METKVQEMKKKKSMFRQWTNRRMAKVAVGSQGERVHLKGERVIPKCRLRAMKGSSQAKTAPTRTAKNPTEPKLTALLTAPPPVLPEMLLGEVEGEVEEEVDERIEEELEV